MQLIRSRWNYVFSTTAGVIAGCAVAVALWPVLRPALECVGYDPKFCSNLQQSGAKEQWTYVYLAQVVVLIVVSLFVRCGTLRLLQSFRPK